MRLAAALVVAAALAHARPAVACSCRFPPAAVLLPADGATGVPRNARVWIASGDGGERLLDADSAPVDAVATSFGGVVVLTPTELLPAGRVFTVEAVDRSTGEGTRIRTTFTTGDALDDAPPDVPAIVDVKTTADLPEVLSGSSCAPTHGATVTFAGAAPLFVVDKDGGGGFDGRALSGTATVVTTTTSAFVGHGACGGGGWSTAGPLATGTLVVGALDVAGNFSGFSPPRAFMLPPPGCSCAAASTSADASPRPRSAGVAVVGALVVSLRRRGRRA